MTRPSSCHNPFAAIALPAGGFRAVRIVGWIGPMLAACLLLAPLLRLAVEPAAAGSVQRASSIQTAAKSALHLPAACRPRSELVRWCELPGCTAGESRSSLAGQHALARHFSAGSAAAAPVAAWRAQQIAPAAEPAPLAAWQQAAAALPTRLRI